ncbi:MAG: peroxidase family protein [Myxococcota bacterium]
MPDDAHRALNRVTSWVDGSVVYGSDNVRAKALRSMKGGRLRTSRGHHLPRYGLDEDNLVCETPGDAFERQPANIENENPRREPASSLYLAGDERANENPILLSLHTVFLREHNRYAEHLAKMYPQWTDEQLYQEARRWVGAIIQSITYYEYLPRLIGYDALEPYSGYRPEAAEPISWVFAAAAFRFGHSQLGPTLFRNDAEGNEFEFSDVSLKAAFFATPLYDQSGPEPWLAGASATLAEKVDLWMIDDLRNYMFGGHHGGLDLAAINLKVGRENLASSLNAIRRHLGLRPLKSWEELTPDHSVISKLRKLYHRVEDIDPWIAFLAEPAPTQDGRGVVGITLKAVLAHTFAALRNGDRFYFEHDPALASRRTELRNTRLADVIRRNMRGAEWTNASIPNDVFIARSVRPNQRILHTARGYVPRSIAPEN